MAAYQRTAGTILALQCIECGASFSHTAKPAGRRPLHCSDDCRKTRRSSAATVDRAPNRPICRSTSYSLVCVECSKPFECAVKKQQCCGRECGWKLARRNQNIWRAEQAARRHARTCVECGKAFTMRHPSGRALRGLTVEGQFCSRECAGSNKLWSSFIERRRAIRRMKKRAKFKARDVFERDGWRCLRCGNEVSRDAIHPDPLSGCVNLIVPGAKGGKRQWNNVALTHLACAVERRARDLRGALDPRSP